VLNTGMTASGLISLHEGMM